ncbi:MAG: preprotein translocase subunit SecG [Actinomycetaceae bacterium]|nr:preprotein translocase subunit SecG [Actinomycetaceae bacterium]MDU0969526.1 preprotein translocase subunit SecG [Actinomycetaceae bacterium]
MHIVTIVCEVILVISSIFLILTVLMHKGKGGGLSDMFGGGFTSTAGSSGVAERNLNRITIGIALVWIIVVIVLGVLMRFSS